MEATKAWNEQREVQLISRGFEVKTIDFYGDSLIAVKDEDTGKIYTGVSYICRGIGLTKDQKDRQVKNIQVDLILNRGCFKFDAGVIDPNNEALGIEIEYIPMWLAKISITPLMQEKQPEVTEKLIRYQLKAKEVLAKAFFNQPSYMINDEIERAKVWIKEQEQKQALEKENKEQQQYIEEAQPHIEFSKAIDATGYSILVEDFAKVVANSGVIMGRNKIMEWLRKNKYISNNPFKRNKPYQQYVDKGYLTHKEHPVLGKGLITFTPLITPKGQKYFTKKLLEEFQEQLAFN